MGCAVFLDLHMEEENQAVQEIFSATFDCEYTPQKVNLLLIVQWLCFLKGTCTQLEQRQRNRVHLHNAEIPAKQKKKLHSSNRRSVLKGTR